MCTLLIALAALAAAAGLHLSPAEAHVRAPDVTLVDQYGRPFNFAAQAGRPRVLFFGYTHCGDVCPLTLEKLEHAKTAAGAAADALEVVFITVDPQRDSPAVLQQFIGRFDRSFFALTGSRKATPSRVRRISRRAPGAGVARASARV
jgi:protein SCO1/2